MKCDVAIVGAGPAGLFAAYEIITRGNRKLDVVVIEQGHDVDKRKCPVQEFSLCTRCQVCNVMGGVGGAGTLSSGLLNLRPDIGGNLFDLVKDEKLAWDLVNYVDSVFLSYGAPKEVYRGDVDEAMVLERKAAAVGVKFIPITQRHMGSDASPKVIKNFKADLERKGVKFLLETKVLDVEPRRLKLNSGELEAKYILLAPGRIGANWLANVAKKLSIPMRYGPIDIGVRVEVPAYVMEPVIRVNRDPKFHIYTDTYDDFVRTFCVNHQGFVVKEVYDDFVGVNGHSMTGVFSENTNFAFLVRIELTEPLEDTTAYGRSVALQTTVLGGGQPLIQRLGDLRMGRRSTWKRITHSHVRPTLKSVTPGDIAMAMPHRIVADILEGLEKLDEIIPGVASSSTLLYAPEIKFSANRIMTNNDLETPVENIFVAGDGAGLSRGLVTAAATGVIAGRGILKKEGVSYKVTANLA
ncbi:MAG: FAD-dependent oxidoreductase [Candidatus Methanomethylicota archaeon]|uniref:FAD-dependent oxidoreductase n=1 Tax=Thermoproteota archaeon TaxID=2056631 RepID=A0A497F0F6_9CREN|nr:MAG: FAD-dependent oxidoreductase [Candidatus Verstraetearchaeota archaeon]